MLIKKALGIESASGEPNKTKVGTLSRAQIEEIAQHKMPDLNCETLDSAVASVAGTARSMGVEVEQLAK